MTLSHNFKLCIKQVKVISSEYGYIVEFKICYQFTKNSIVCFMNWPTIFAKTNFYYRIWKRTDLQVSHMTFCNEENEKT